jgi:hypothetical protein
MNEQEQKAGEGRVVAMLIDKLDACGFVRPGRMTTEQFAAMRREICQRLAYMSDLSLAALAEVMEHRGSGADRNGFPILPAVMAEAKRVQEPPEDASPFIRRVFAHRDGETALREGWAPELLRHVRDNRGTWPASFVLARLADDARPAIRRMFDLERQLAEGCVLRADDEDWHRRRAAATARAQSARDLGLADAARAVTA